MIKSLARLALTIACVALFSTVTPAQENEPERPTMPPEEFFEGCAEVAQGPSGCVFLKLRDGREVIPDQRPPVEIGERIKVIGGITRFCVTQCMFGDGCITVRDYEKCEPTPIELCGDLVLRSGCAFLFVDEKRYSLIGNVPETDPNEIVERPNVKVTGFPCEPGSDGTCANEDPCIRVVEITNCERTIETCGTLIRFGNCKFFFTPDGNKYSINAPVMPSEEASLANAPIVLIGDYFVSGVITPECTDRCPASHGCINAEIIRPCERKFSACGRLFRGPSGCTGFQTLDGRVFVVDLPNPQDDTFLPRRPIHIRGTLDRLCVDVCQFGEGCIEVAQVNRCRRFLQGDANFDNRVNVSDFISVLLNFGESSDEDPGFEGDTNENGNVGVDDFIEVLMNYGDEIAS